MTQEASTPASTSQERVWNSREFIITLAVLAIGCAVYFNGDKDIGVELITWVALGYIGSRTATKGIETLKKPKS